MKFLPIALLALAGIAQAQTTSTRQPATAAPGTNTTQPNRAPVATPSQQAPMVPTTPPVVPPALGSYPNAVPTPSGSIGAGTATGGPATPGLSGNPTAAMNFNALDADGNGSLTLQESGLTQQQFNTLDTNHDGVLSALEYGNPIPR